MNIGESTPDTPSPYTVAVGPRLQALLDEQGRYLAVNQAEVDAIMGAPAVVNNPTAVKVTFEVRKKWSPLRMPAYYETAEQAGTTDDQIMVFLPRRSVTKGRSVDISNTLAHEAMHAANYDRIGHRKASLRYRLASTACFLSVSAPASAAELYELHQHATQGSPWEYAAFTIAMLIGSLGAAHTLNPYEIRARRHARRQPKVAGVVAVRSLINGPDEA